MSSEKALVLLSGGQDSATCLSIAINEFPRVWSLSFDYGQRHRRELKMAEVLSNFAGTRHTVFNFPTLAQIDQSSTMVTRGGDTRDVGEAHPIHKHLPSSFLPGRNYLMLGLAAVHAFNIGADTIYTGTCETDFSGYPDCRRSTIDAIQTALQLAMDFPALRIRTPLMDKRKSETVKMMSEMGRLNWYAYTQTCYNNQRPPCGTCPSCLLRAKGFEEAGFEDPLLTMGVGKAND